MKKLLLSTIVAVALFAGVATAGQFRVFLVTMDQMDQHWNNVDAGCKKAAAEVGNANYTWMAPDAKDDNKQIEIINNTVAAGADVLLLAANGPDAVTSALREADAAGVKIIYVDSPANYPAIATFSTNNKAAGHTAGLEMLKTLKAAGHSSGKVGIVNINAATQSTVDREAGFREAFEGAPFELLATQYGEGDVARSKDIAANYIVQGCIGIFGANEGATTGVGTAILEDGNQVIGVGFDNSDSIRGLIRGGSLICAMVQNPDVMGYMGLKAAAEAMAGGYKGAKVVDTGVTVMTKDKL
ncbi:MAG: substrate-binding domain-containing protein [Planctomycetota bacterium]|jgi:ribose transport system substrate-binding protein|nr:substrate-binding domain-containing protein [Planctomycetota bacterium]